MQAKIDGPLTISLEENDILFSSGEHDNDLYVIHSGKLMVFLNKGSQITPLAYLGEGEFIGELSFFDKEVRSANVMAIEETTLMKIPCEEIDKQCPPWLSTIACNITKKIRNADELIRNKGIRKKNVESIKPLSTDEQGEVFRRLKKYREENNISS